MFFLYVVMVGLGPTTQRCARSTVVPRDKPEDDT